MAGLPAFRTAPSSKGQFLTTHKAFGLFGMRSKFHLQRKVDHLLAREMLLRIAEETAAHFLKEAENAWKQVTDNFRIENPRLGPTVALVVNGGCLEFTVGYIVDYTERASMKDRLFTKVAEEIRKSNGRLDWASPSTAAPKPSATADLSG